MFISLSLSLLKKLELTQQFVENVCSALQPLHRLMPSEDSDLTKFFAGEPPTATSAAIQESDTEEGPGEGEEGEGGEVGESGESGEGVGASEDAPQPQRIKKSRSQVKALNVQTLQVFNLCACCLHTCLRNECMAG